MVKFGALLYKAKIYGAISRAVVFLFEVLLVLLMSRGKCMLLMLFFLIYELGLCVKTGDLQLKKKNQFIIKGLGMKHILK